MVHSDAGAFVICSGRCGSTALGRELNRHPDLASINEFCSMIGGAPTVERWARSTSERLRDLSVPSARTAALLRTRTEPSEFLYDIDHAPYTRSRGVPPLLEVTLPALYSDPDEAWLELEREVAVGALACPNGSDPGLGSIFEFLAARAGKKHWIERSAGSYAWVTEVISAFPRARLIHLYRDGADTVTSMAHHVAFRMAHLGLQLKATVGFDPYACKVDELPSCSAPDLVQYWPDVITRAAVLGLTIPVRSIAAFWTLLVTKGCRDLARHPKGLTHHVRYSDLLQNPRAVMTSVAHFLDLDAPDTWLRQCEDTLRPQGRRRLSEEEHRSIARLCGPGERAIREVVG